MQMKNVILTSVLAVFPFFVHAKVDGNDPQAVAQAFADGFLLGRGDPEEAVQLLFMPVEMFQGGMTRKHIEKLLADCLTRMHRDEKDIHGMDNISGVEAAVGDISLSAETADAVLYIKLKSDKKEKEIQIIERMPMKKTLRGWLVDVENFELFRRDFKCDKEAEALRAEIDPEDYDEKAASSGSVLSESPLGSEQPGKK